jgi:2-polyprenyl-3-methyl-5-hydroxy-6-metoxy-1,4-benzoquinol methylase
MHKSVSPDLYTRDYYLSDCSGYSEFLRSNGKDLDPRLTRLLPFLDYKPGQHLLDIGCGRGEIVINAAYHQVIATGIDYAKAAIKLAQKALATYPKKIQKLTSFSVMDAKSLSFADQSFDIVTATDVVEHLYPHELLDVYQEVYRVLKPNGQFIIHTEPNRWYQNFTYPLYCYPISQLFICLNRLLTRHTYPPLPPPSSLRTPAHQQLHVNEATYLNLQRGLTHAGFKVKIITKVTILKPILSIKDHLYNFGVCLDPLSRYFPLNLFFANDFIVVASKL